MWRLLNNEVNVTVLKTDLRVTLKTPSSFSLLTLNCNIFKRVEKIFIPLVSAERQSPISYANARKKQNKKGR
jgi:hypothetical protein